MYSILVLGSLPLVSAYWRQICGISQMGRVDPIVSPGVVSSHVHKLAGASDVNINSTYESLQESTCTTCEITGDKSAYWTPQLYYEHANGTFEEVLAPGMTVYYMGRGDNRENIVPFPPGFMMVSGSPFPRSYDNSTLTWGNATYPNRPIADRVSFNCLDADGPYAEQPYMWRTNCSDGLRAQIQFQSCWNGIELYMPDNSHVAYMTQIDNGICPPEYPVQFVHLFYEVLYGVNNIDQSDGGDFVFAYGDPTGYGFHGDFMNGWNPELLQSALTQCANTDNDGVVDACAPLLAVDNLNFAYNCPEEDPVIPSEVVHGIVGDQLPGCINIIDGPAPAQLSDIICPATVIQPAVIYPSQTPDVVLTPTTGQKVGLPGWEYISCYQDLVNGTRTLSALTMSASNQSVETCQTFCTSKGYQYAGAEYGDECYCDAVISAAAPTAIESDCNMLCAGNKTENCGAGFRISIYNNTTPTRPSAANPTTAAAGTWVGCAADPNIRGRALTGSTYESAFMTLESCRLFCANRNYPLSGVEGGTTCYCGSALQNGGAFLASPMSCNTPCAGNKRQKCGGTNRLSVFMKSPTTNH